MVSPGMGKTCGNDRSLSAFFWRISLFVTELSLVNGEYYAYQRDTDKNSSMDDFAGEPGTSIDRLQMYIR